MIVFKKWCFHRLAIITGETFDQIDWSTDFQGKLWIDEPPFELGIKKIYCLFCLYDYCFYFWNFLIWLLLFMCHRFIWLFDLWTFLVILFLNEVFFRVWRYVNWCLLKRLIYSSVMENFNLKFINDYEQQNYEPHK